MKDKDFTYHCSFLPPLLLALLLLGLAQIAKAEPVSNAISTPPTPGTTQINTVNTNHSG